MNTRYCFGPESICGPISSSSNNSSATDDRSTVLARARLRGASEGPATFMVRLVMRISRARWFSFLRRVFHYQNGSRSDLGSNPFNSSRWMALELLALVVQICITTTTLMVSKEEKPVWPMRIWIVGYDIGCVFSILMLYGRYRQLNSGHRDNAFTLLDIEQQHRGVEEESRTWDDVMNKSRTSLELLFAIWFVMGNVWVLDSRLGSLKRAPKLHYLCVSLLAWNAITYSFPFLLFLLLCCFVPLISTLLGYNMNMGSLHKGASDHQISNLPTWNFKELEANTNLKDPNNEDSECCCICLAKYRDKEQVRQLPCSHLFHLNCVDQWLKIISCCPLCKQQLER